jgi:hypothetical protein
MIATFYRKNTQKQVRVLIFDSFQTLVYNPNIITPVGSPNSSQRLSQQQRGRYGRMGSPPT